MGLCLDDNLATRTMLLQTNLKLKTIHISVKKKCTKYGRCPSTGTKNTKVPKDVEVTGPDRISLHMGEVRLNLFQRKQIIMLVQEGKCSALRSKQMSR